MKDTNKASNNKTHNSKKRKPHHGRNVQVCREIRGVKQSALAELIGVSTRTMARYESQDILENSILEKISEILNFSIEFMEELNTNSNLKVINVNEGGKLFTDSSQDKNFESNSTDSSSSATNNGISIENYDRIYEMLMTEREKVIRLEIELKILKEQKGNN
ncbi:MAG: helix-turn-helix domain-containing protein [Prevotellaceae bacterium]|jgi:transcriptional regulator with XRE-family HTH domain|nr:helix-turn-helix domain-containing protein [Prevotellaceae bacterium]